MSKRDCEFCENWTPEYLEHFFTADGNGEYDVCVYCSGTKELDSKECFCHAYEPGECACDADWSDYVYWEDL